MQEGKLPLFCVKHVSRKVFFSQVRAGNLRFWEIKPKHNMQNSCGRKHMTGKAEIISRKKKFSFEQIMFYSEKNVLLS